MVFVVRPYAEDDGGIFEQMHDGLRGVVHDLVVALGD
jgi:hypothetical protein